MSLKLEQAPGQAPKAARAEGPAAHIRGGICVAPTVYSHASQSTRSVNAGTWKERERATFHNEAVYFS